MQHMTELAKILDLNCTLTSKLGEYEKDRKCWMELIRKNENIWYKKYAKTPSILLLV